MAGAPEFTCVFCGATFPNRPLLQDHFRLHGTPKDTKHRKKHNSKTQFSGTTAVKCDICLEEFDCVSRAIFHKFRKHNNEDVKYFCPWCGKRFPIKHTLETHVKIHSDEIVYDESYKCHDCDVTFYKEEALDYHRVSYHDNPIFVKKVNVPPPSKKIYVNSCGDVQSTFYCHLCGQEYVVKYNLQRHIADVHGLESCNTFTDIIKCNICDALFYNQKAYVYHNTFHKPTDMYVTNEEMRLNVVTKVDQDFDLRRVRSLFSNEQGKSSRMSRQSIEKLLEAANQNATRESLSKTDSAAARRLEAPNQNPTCDSLSKTDGDTTSLPDMPTVSVKSIKTYERKTSKKIPKNAILLGEFMNMNKEIFSFDDKSKDVKIKVEEVEKPDSIPSYDIDMPISIIGTIPIEHDSDDKSTALCGISMDTEKSDSKGKQASVKKSEPTIKYLTKEELQKLKGKGLIRLTSKPKSLVNMKKVNIIKVEENKPLLKTKISQDSMDSQVKMRISRISNQRIGKKRKDGQSVYAKEMKYIEICKDA